MITKLTKITTFLMLLILAAGSGHAANRMYVEPINIEPGLSETLTLCLTNDVACYGFQAEITLPAGVQWVTKSDGQPDVSLSERFEGKGYQIIANTKNIQSGKVILGVFSTADPQEAITGNAGVIMTIPVKTLISYAGGDVRFNNVRIVDSSDQDVYLGSGASPIGVLPLSVTVMPAEIEINRGATGNLTTSIYPTYATDKSVTWTSADDNIATVDANGVVTAVNIGKTTITATTVNGKRNTCAVDVVAYCEGLSLDRTQIEIERGKTDTLIPLPIPADTTDPVTWSSSDESVAVVVDGIVTAIGKGHAVITATCGAHSASCDVEVYVLASAVVVNHDYVQLMVGNTSELILATVLPEETNDKTLTWTSSDPSIATVSAEGDEAYIMAHSLGETTINVSCGQAMTTILVKVVPTPVESVTLNESYAEMMVNHTLNLIPTVLPEDATDKTVIWKSSNPEVATVDGDGIVTALSLGDTQITASVATKSAICHIKVVPTPAESISLEPDKATMRVGGSVKLTETIYPDDTTDKSVTWTSSNPAVATVDGEGNVTALALGEAEITAQCGDVSAKSLITVEPTPVTSLTVSESSIELKVTETFTLEATVLPEDATYKTVTWSTANDAIATVDVLGKITAMSVGETEVTASCGDFTAICRVTVIPTLAESITLDPTAATVLKGESLIISATVLPATTTDKTIVWTSDDEGIATVDASGKVTATGVGETTVTATCGDVSATSIITVPPVPVRELSLSSKNLLLKVGNVSDLDVIFDPADATDQRLTWASADESIASVDENGNVTAIAIGTTTITVTSVPYPNVKAVCEVVVEAAVINVTNIWLNESNITLVEGDTFQLDATLTPDDATDPTVTWETTDAAKATVSNTGLVTAVLAGSATIMASSSNGLTAKCDVTVLPKKIEVKGISLSQSTLLIHEGETAELLAIIAPDNADDKNVIWSTADASTAAVDQSGKVTGVLAGETVITATASNGMTATCIVTVIPNVIPVTGIMLSEHEKEVIVGDAFTLTATITPTDATDKTVTWKTENPAVATVSDSGEVTTVGVGQTRILASSSNGLTDICTVTVNRGIVWPTGIRLSNESMTLYVGDTTDLLAIVEPADADDKSVVWSTGDATIATVDQQGIVNALQPGEVVITATTVNGLTDTCTITVLPKEIQPDGIILSETEKEVIAGDVFTLTATVTPEDATDKSVTWISSNPDIATVTSTGAVTTLTPGEVTIMASTVNGKTATCKVTVIPRKVLPAGISLFPEELTLYVGETGEMLPIIEPADATETSLKWSTDAGNIAFVNDDGKITAVSPGEAIITVTTVNNITATGKVTVITDVVYPTGIIISETEKEVIVGDVFSLSATIEPADATDKSVTWRSSDPDKASVSETGEVTTKEVGEVYVFASSSNGLTTSCKVKINPRIVEPTGVSITPDNLTIYVGETGQLRAVVEPEDVTYPSVIWSTDDLSILSVEGMGFVTGLMPGTGVITVTTVNGMSATCTVTVLPNEIPVSGITLDTEKEVTVGDVFTLTATIQPEDATDKTITWRSSDPDMASVSETGEVTTKAVGEVIIFASSANGVTAECKVTINPRVIEATGVTLTPESLTLYVGETGQLRAVVEPEDVTDPTVIWRASDSGNVSVDEQGFVTGLIPGVGIVSVLTSNGKSATCTVTVLPNEIPVSGITLDESKEVTEGDVFTLTAIIEPEDATDKTITWRSSDPDKASVSQTGEVTTKVAGEVTIFASSSNGMTAECKVTINPRVIEATGVTVAPDNLTIYVGETGQLRATVEPADVTDSSVIWSADGSGIVTVDEQGFVSGVMPGAAIVTVTTANGKSATCTVTVLPNEIPVSSITLEDSKEVTVGDIFTLTATIEPEDATDKTITWRSSDPNTASVSQTGEVTTKAVGEVTIFASSANGMTAECKVTIRPGIIDVERISLSNTELTLTEGEVSDLLAIVIPADATNQKVTWKIADSDIARIEDAASTDASGNITNKLIVTALKAGETIITVTSDADPAVTAECKLIVNPAFIAVTDITLDEHQKEMEEGETFKLTATITPEDATDKTITWSSSSEAVATVSDTGVVTAVSYGTATIYATASNGKYDVCEVTVLRGNVDVTGIVLSNADLLMEVGDKASLTAMVEPADATVTAVTWQTANPSIATVDENGNVEAIGVGETIITVTSVSNPEITATCNVTVKSGIINVVGITLDEHSKELEEGDDFTLTATITPSDATDKSVTWTSSNTAVATVSDTGKVTAVSVGAATIYATASNGAFDTCDITVFKDIDPTGVIISAADITLTVGDTAALQAFVQPDDATDKTVTWSSANPGIATVDASGVVTAVEAGEAIVTVKTVNGLEATCKVTVMPVIVSVTGITLDPKEKEVTVGDTFKINASIEPSNASDLTITWKSSDPAKATVSETGEVITKEPGEVIIYASSANGVTSECKVTINPGYVEVTSISLSNSTLTMTEGDVSDLLAIIIPADATNQKVSWKIDNSEIATVEDASATDDSGLITNKSIVTALKAGNAVITVTSLSDPDVSAECVLTVLPAYRPVMSITLNEHTKELEQEETFTLEATVTPEDASDKTVTWSTSAEDVATVSDTGVVTAVSPGTAIIYATASNGLYDACEVTVLKGEVAVTRISLSQTEMTLTEGDVSDLLAIVIPSDATDQRVTWAIDNSEIAMVEPEQSRELPVSVAGKSIITALMAGEAIITVTSVSNPEVSAECHLTVLPAYRPVTGISLNEHTKELDQEETFTLVATITPEDASDKSVTWSSSAETVATVSETGLVTAVSPGTAIIYATASNGLYDACEVTVLKGEVAVTRISLSQTEMTLTEGDVSDLLAIVIPSDATDQRVTWSIDDSEIATVEPESTRELPISVADKSIITALKAGEAIITVTSVSNPEVSAECRLTVIPAYHPVLGITLNEHTKELEQEETFTLEATITPEDASDKTVIWSSSAEGVATVSDTGVVTAVSPGTAIIYATASNGMYDACEVTVLKGDVDVLRISLSQTEMTLNEGDVSDLLAIVIPSDATDQRVTWSIENDEIATIDPLTTLEEEISVASKSIITALKAGETVITVTSVSNPEVSAECKLTVLSAFVPVETITLNEHEKVIEEGEKFTLIATVTPENATDRSITWVSSNPNIADVSAEGEVTGISMGEATIYASTCNGLTDRCVVTVVRDVDVTEITLSNSELFLTVGEETDVIAIVLPADATDKRVTWMSEDSGIATVDADGNVTAISVGETKLIVTSVSNPNVTAECRVVVSEPFISVEGITLNEEYLTLDEGEVFTLIATVTPETATDKTVTWRSSDEAIATVSASGDVTAISAGEAVIYASTSNGLTAICYVTVNRGDVEVTHITLSNSELLLTEGETAELIPLLRPFDATDQSVTWTSDDEATATVNENGIVSAIKQGVTIVRATTGNGLTAECKVTVVPLIIPVTDISLNKTKLVLTEGEIFNLIATITPENATDRTVTWISTSVDIATVSDGGVVTASKAGEAVIYASSSNGLTAQCDVTVLPLYIPETSITLDATDLTIWVGQTESLIATILPSDATDKSVTWTSNHPEIVIVEDGFVTGLQEGVATVMAKSAGGKTAFCSVTVKGRPLTPKQLLRKGDGTTSTFVIMMEISDQELAERGYNFITGYTDAAGHSEIIADTPLRYSHTTPEIYNNPAYDFWAFSYLKNEAGEILTSNLRHLDGSEEVCFDPSIYGFNPDENGGESRSDDNWLTITPDGLYISTGGAEDITVAVYSTTGAIVYKKTYSAKKVVIDMIEMSQFASGSYVVTLRKGDDFKSEKIWIK